jgi:hypothetical protein
MISIVPSLEADASFVLLGGQQLLLLLSSLGARADNMFE